MAALSSSSNIPLYTSNEVLKAKVLMASKSVASHYSHRSMDEFPEVLRLVLPDSKLAREICLGPTKLGYTINNGLKKYY